MSLAHFNLDKFSGINLQDSAHELEPHELVEAQDVVLNSSGKIRRRGGYTNRTGGHTLSSTTKVLAANLHAWDQRDSAVLFVATTASATKVYLMSSGDAPVEIFSFDEVADYADIEAGWTAGRTENNNPALNTSIVTTDLFTIAVVYDDIGYIDNDVDTTANQVRFQVDGASGSNWNLQLTYIAGKNSVLASIPGQQFSGGTGSAGTAEPIFGEKYGFKYVGLSDYYNFLAGRPGKGQMYHWSGDPYAAAGVTKEFRGGQNAHKWYAGDFDHITTEDNDLIRGIRSLGNQVIFLKQKNIVALAATPDPKDFSQYHRAKVGCADHRSIQKYEDSLIFANYEGVFAFNGREAVELSGNIKDEWRSRIEGHRYNTWSIAGAVVGDYYIVSIINALGNQVGDNALCLHIPTQSWTTISNLPMVMSSVSETGELTYGFLRVDDDEYRIVNLTEMFDSRLGLDSLGTGPRMIVQTARLTMDDPFQMKNFRQLMVDYKSTAYSGTGTAALGIKYVGGLASYVGSSAWSGVTTSLDNLTLQSTPTRARRTFALKETAIGFRITEDTTGGNHDIIELNGLSIAFKPMRANRV